MWRILLFILYLLCFQSSYANNDKNIKIICKNGEFKCKAYFFDKEFDVNIGKNSLTNDKQEGDLSTPIGIFQLESYVFYRNDDDIVVNPNLEIRKIQDNYKWCDDQKSKLYNKFFVLNDEMKDICHSYEDLLRKNGAYDYIVPIKYNDDPVVSGKGSAIFVHVKRGENIPTAGCVAFAKNDLRFIIENIGNNATIDINFVKKN